MKVAPQKFTPRWLAGRLAELLPGYPKVGIVVAVSGGLDSTALLAALAASRRARLQLRAAHVNHGLHPKAAEWAAHCGSTASALGIPLEVLATKVVRSAGVSVEEAAREARYGLLERILQPGEFLLTAHHEDDQLETVLLQLFRGAGIAGLAAMPELCRFGAGWLARPLLPVSRQKLDDWVRSAGLTWVEDAMNSDESLDRNYLRRRVLPLVRERWQGVGSAVARSARHAAAGQRLLDMIARGDVERASSGADLSVPVLRALQLDRRRNALRYWIARSGARVPDTRRLDELAGPVIEARHDANPRIEWSGAQVQRHSDLLSIRVVERGRGDGVVGIRRGPGSFGEKISLTRSASRESSAREPSTHGSSTRGSSKWELVWPWTTQRRLELPEGSGSLELRPDPHGPIDLDVLPERVVVRLRQGGERLRPRRGGPRRALKSLLQESQLPIAARGQLPLLYSGATLLAAGALWIDESIQITPAAVHRGRLIHGHGGE